MQYLFALGKHNNLSQAEIQSLLFRLKINYQLLFSQNHIIGIDSQENLAKLIDQLGGTIKIGKILKTIDSLPTADKLNKFLICPQNKKFSFGISTYNFNYNKILKLGLEIKKLQKKDNIKSRFVSSQQNPLSSVIVKKNNLLGRHGAELIIAKINNKYVIGKTLTIQDFAKYSKIDYGRPAYDKIAGMLPPKVAQIMVNLAKQNIKAKILDPFCGSGTILQMAAWLGYKNLIGCDKNHQAISNCQTNLTWLANEFDLDFHLQLFEQNVTNLSKQINANSIDAIISEPYLGPPLHGSESLLKIQKNIKILTQIYQLAFAEFKKVLKPDGKIIIIIPEFNIKGKSYQINVNKLINKKFKLLDSYHYSRPGQKVARNILVLS